MRAIMLAAGVGARLGGGPERPPKVLLEFGGVTLLRRHLDILRQGGVDQLVLVIGYKADAVRSAIAVCGADDFARTVINPHFREGSVVSLWAARHELVRGGDVLLMDADVLYDHRLMDRLITSRHTNCLLLDRHVDAGEEPVKVCIRDGRIVDFAKRIGTEHDYYGESVGFFRLGAEIGGRLAERAEAYVNTGRRDAMYEEALRDVLLESAAETFGFEDITGLPWIEIDFPEDIRRARTEILPRLEERVP